MEQTLGVEFASKKSRGCGLQVDKPARLIIRLLFGFVSDSVFSICQTQPKSLQILIRQCCGLQGSAVCGWRNGGEGGLEHRGDLLPVEQRVEQDEQAYD